MGNANNNEDKEPLILTWNDEIELDNQGILLKNLIHVTAYVSQNLCSKTVINNILSQVQQHIKLDDIYDFIMACSLMEAFNVNDLSKEKEMLKSAREVLNRFIEAFEYAYGCLDDNLKLGHKTIDDKKDDDFFDISNLEVGMVIQKGYTELCKLVGEKQYKSGSNQRKAQEKRWKRFIKIEKSELCGGKLIITEIYDEPLPKEDKRKLGNNSIYLKYIETILLRYVCNRNNRECYITKNQLWLILGMINKNYEKIPYSMLKNDTEYSDVKEWELNNFYMRCNTKLNSILYSALNNLKSRSLIEWSKQIMIVIPDDECKTYSHHYIASDIEIEKILAVERRVLKDMGFESKSHVMCKMQMPKFYEKVNRLLYDLYGWERKYERIKIIFNYDDVKEALQQDEYRLQMMLLNELVVGAIDKNAQVVVDNQNKKVIKQYEERIKECFGKQPGIEEMDNIFTYPKYYVDIQKKLSKKFLSIEYAKEEDMKKRENRILFKKEIDDLFANLGQE